MRRLLSSLVLLASVGCAPAESSSTSEPPGWGTAPEREDDPGRVTLNRLSRTEVERSLHALLRTDVPLVQNLPADGVAYGFDNNAAAQTMSALHVEAYEAAIDRAIRDGLRPPVVSEVIRHQPEDASWSGKGGDNCHIGTHPTWQDCVALWFDASHSTVIRVEHSGTYTARLFACQAYGTAMPELALLVDNEVVARWDIEADCRTGEEVEATITLDAGLHDLGIAQIARADTKMLGVDHVELEGPHEATGAWPPGRTAVYVCDPEAGAEEERRDCARTVLETFARRAWRRPVDDEDVSTLLDVYDEAVSGGSDVHHALAQAVKRALLSPWFLYRVEVPDRPDGPAQPLSDHELAARLSYFLWSRHPDEVLREAADAGRLTDPAELEAQARRMLADPRAEALVDGLGAQWLGLDRLDRAAPDPLAFPTFDASLRGAMRAEMRALVQRAFLSDVPVASVFTASERWVEPPLDVHYGVEGQTGWVRVPDRPGGGLLTSAGWLTATSTPTRTSPVKRGAWVAAQVLCEDPPPPPDGVETELDEGDGARTVAEQLAEHRADPVCASCHDQIDPIGLAMEPYDGIGAARAAYADGTPIDPAGALVGVGSFSDTSDLARQLAEQARTRRCMVQKTLTWALGRGTRAHDWPDVRAIEARFGPDGRFSDLVVGVVLSDAFRMHRGEVSR